MRRTLAAVTAAAFAALVVGAFASPASAICDGDPCSDCPKPILKIIKVEC
jgi:hypothetical protein